MKNVILYARVSSARQKEGETVQSQISALIDYANKCGYTIPNGWIFKDEGVSGSKLQRPALDALRELIQENLADVVLVYSPDRLSRKHLKQKILRSSCRYILRVFLPSMNEPKLRRDVVEGATIVRDKEVFLLYLLHHLDILT